MPAATGSRADDEDFENVEDDQKQWFQKRYAPLFSK